MKSSNGILMHTSVEAWNPSVSSSQDVVASVVFFVDELTRSYATTCSEVIFIGDCKNFSFAQAQQAGPRIIMQAVDLFVVRGLLILIFYANKCFCLLKLRFSQWIFIYSGYGFLINFLAHELNWFILEMYPISSKSVSLC